MALIEHLNQDGSEVFLRAIFGRALKQLATDRFGYAGSALDDSRAG